MPKRIDLTQFEGLTTPWDFGKKYPHIESAKVAVELIAELKRMYAREDELLDALRIIRNDLNEGMAQGHLPIESTHGVSARGKSETSQMMLHNEAIRELW